MFWVSFWLVVQGVFVSWGLWLGWHNDVEHARLVRTETTEDDIEEAIRCVDAWDIADKSRDSNEAVYRRITETLIETSNVPPGQVAEYRQLIERDVAEIRGLIDNPTCDIDAARLILGD